jgi:glycogen debranching enzyme
MPDPANHDRNLIRLHTRPDTLYVSRGRTVLATNGAGAIDGAWGLFVHETRLLSRYRYLVDGRAPYPVALSNVGQSSWLGYYVTLPDGVETGEPDHGSGQLAPLSQQTVELRVSRAVGEGLHEDLDLTNFTQQPVAFDFEIHIDADFADLADAGRAPAGPSPGTVTRSSRTSADAVELEFSFAAEHRFDHQGERGIARLERGAVVRLTHGAAARTVERDRVRFRIALPPQACWHACVKVLPRIDGRALAPPDACYTLRADPPPASAHPATRFSAPGSTTLTGVVVGALERAMSDLRALRLDDLDHGPDAWTMAAGLPLYVALFGRDTLTASWQAAIAGPEPMRGSLLELARWQGTRDDDWRDEQPGRMLHEAHTGPLEMLELNPRARSYSSVTTSAFFPAVLAELWHWTGDKAFVQPLIRPALDALAWIDRCCEGDPDGFCRYHTRSKMGVKHQAWKDSGDAIVDDEGRQIDPPIATCEEQAFAYAARFLIAELLWSLDQKDEARSAFRKARDLKARFNDKFWMDDQQFIALGLDSAGRPIRSLTSNPGHCVASGIVDDARVPAVADRLMRDDLFSGWGIRTLSAGNPAYNPYSYHRGSVWPVEQGTFVLGFVRYGLHEHAARLTRAQFEAAALFEAGRLPELFAGHQRDERHPFPALYPQANSPQAWSASALLMMAQSLLGLYPYAPLHLLLVDPQLPEWLPELTLSNLRVGEAQADIRFFRTAGGASDYRVLDVRGPLHVVRQPSPWSLTAGVGERAIDLLRSLVPGR